VEDGKQVPYEAPGGSNPALQVRIERPDGTTAEGFIFEGFPPVFPTAIELDLRYQRVVRDYVSSLEIVEADQVVAAKDIEVNHPLHYGGYHLFQDSYGQDRFGEYTVLQVVSDSGLNVVYAGYVMLIGGIVWHLWGHQTLDRLRTSATPAGQP
jgi:cytochrome c biogenesis protein ResB